MRSLKATQVNWPLEEVLKTIELHTEEYNVHVTYPEYILSGQPIYVFNIAISAEIGKYVGNFIDEATQLMLFNERKSELLGEHTTYTAFNRYITIKIDFYTYLGGIHPDHNILTTTFDTFSNSIISLNDLVGLTADKLKQLSLLAERALLEKYPDLNFAFNDPTFRRGFAPKEENFQYWAITDHGFIFFFPEYQAAPYAAGTLSVEIPFSSFSN